MFTKSPKSTTLCRFALLPQPFCLTSSDVLLVLNLASPVFGFSFMVLFLLDGFHRPHILIFTFLVVLFCHSFRPPALPFRRCSDRSLLDSSAYFRLLFYFSPGFRSFFAYTTQLFYCLHRWPYFLWLLLLFFRSAGYCGYCRLDCCLDVAGGTVFTAFGTLCVPGIFARPGPDLPPFSVDRFPIMICFAVPQPLVRSYRPSHILHRFVLLVSFLAFPCNSASPVALGQPSVPLR